MTHGIREDTNSGLPSDSCVCDPPLIPSPAPLGTLAFGKKVATHPLFNSKAKRSLLCLQTSPGAVTKRRSWMHLA